MLKIQTLALGNYQTNCYILREETANTCALIDPGCDAGYVLETVARQDLTVEAILLTHGHFDHVGAVAEITEKTGCELWMHPGDHQPQNGYMAGFFYPLSNRKLLNVRYCDEGDTIAVAGLTISVLATPGHTEGSVCYECEDALFTGDTLFAGSCGRTDLPGGSHKVIQASLARLANLEKNYAVYPGHGESSDLATEKRSNPYL
ncbi:MAG: MBL fold metallo-hydrolase [Ruminococcaceae bacterium]|nr:MBL fold metallo-hydrolase [Oscillospiraceae bacterium]